jgi:predicted ATPase
VWAFAAALTAVAQHAHPSDELCDQCAQTLAQAAALYKADFMAGFSLDNNEQFEEWQFFQREAYRQKMMGLLQQLVSWTQAQHQYEAGIIHTQRWLSLDPWHEPAHRTLMTLYGHNNQRAAALRQYEACVQLLETELEIEPEPETMSLFEAIRDRTFADHVGTERKKATAISRSSPLRTGAHLPIPPTPLIGREEELQLITSLLYKPETRLITVVGAGGMGKTRLALAAASAVADHLEHGVYFIELAPLTAAEHIITTLASALTLTLRGSEPQTALLDYLRDKTLLLLMDNFEHLLSGVNLLHDVLQAAPGVKLLVTSRERLNLSGETVYVLGGLPLQSSETAAASPAFQLFQQHLHMVNPTYILRPEDHELIDQICNQVEGMPLALILAASWAEMLSLAEIKAEIDNSLNFLETDMVDIPERQRSLRAVFAASWQQLTAEEKIVFRRLTIFRGGFTRQAAQAAAGATLPTLRRLVQKLFVTAVENGRYQIHELLRQFGAERLRASNTYHTAQEAHAVYYLSLLQQREVNLRGRNQLDALYEIDADLENIRLAWGYAVVQRDEAAIAQALEGLHLFIDARGRYVEGIPLLEQARRQLVPNGKQTQNPTWGRLTARARFMALASSGYSEGLDDVIETCLAIAQKAQDRFEIAFCLYFQAFHLIGVKHDPENSLKSLQQALTIFRDIGDPIFTARCLNMLGVVHLHRENPAQSRACFEEALHLSRKQGAVTDTNYTLSNLCEIVLSLGDYEAGEAYAREALTLMAQLQQRVVSSYVNVLMGLCLLLKGELDEAKAYIQKGWDEGKLVNFAVTLTYAPALLALCQALQGDYQAAQPLAEKGLVNPMNDRLGHILGQWAMAMALLGLNKRESARAYLCRAAEHAKNYPSAAMLT